MICEVREGLTGILTISCEGRSETYIPNYDQDQARELLLEFQALQDDTGGRLTKNYQAEGYNWYPSMVSYLYWYLFFPFVKYAPLVAEWMAGQRHFRWQGQGQFRTLLELLGETGYRQTWRTRLHYLALRLNNRLVARYSTAGLLFFRFAQNDFRTAEIRRTLGQLGIDYLDVAPAPRTLEIPSSYLKGERTYYFSQPPGMNRGMCS